MHSRRVPRVVLVNKPYGMLSQFTGAPGVPTLAEIVPFQDMYAAGRLDADSEGLLVLTSDGALQARIAHPKFKLEKRYWAQVEGVPIESAIAQLSRGVMLRDGPTRPAHASVIPEPPSLWERTPPIRHRKSVPTAWIELRITEGRNRQVRRMTAAVGHPTLRLIRVGIGPWHLSPLSPGEWREVPDHEIPRMIDPGDTETKKPASRRAFRRHRTAPETRGGRS